MQLTVHLAAQRSTPPCHAQPEAALAQAALKASVICGGLGSASKLPMGWYSSLPGPSSTRRKTWAGGVGGRGGGLWRARLVG